MASAPYRIEFAPAAERDFRALPRRAQEKLRPRIDALANNPRPHKAKKLQGEENLYRLRVGEFRIIYSIFDGRLLITVLKIGNRKDVYRGL